MNKKNWKTYGLWIALAEGVGGLSGWLSRKGMQEYEAATVKPPLSPPGIVFPIAWGILYALMGFGAARVYLSEDSAARSRGLNLFIAQLAVNFFWSLIFFNKAAYLLALLWLILLWILVFAMMRSFRQADKLAGKLQIPYLAWLTFAAWLNAGTWYLNR